MKFCLLVLLAVIFASCGPTESKKATKETDEAKVENETEEHVEPEIEKMLDENCTWNYYLGTVGVYDEEVIVELAFVGDSVFGGYWYLKHGKKLSLSGNLDPKSNDLHLTESYKGKTTGKFTVFNYEDSIVGSWTTPRGVNAGQNVHLKSVLKNQNDRFNPKFEKFVQNHEITIYNYNGEDDESYENQIVEDEMNLVKIGDYILFNYSIIGSNAHVGYISGLAKMKGTKAIFKGENSCVLSIEFVDDKTIKTDENGCSYYRGMRAYFQGELKKVK